MAFDTVIDKAQLESAITASANAIREKTGDTALIEWLSDKGFAEAIAAIESGGGCSPFDDMYCISGTYTPAENETSPVEVFTVENLTTTSSSAVNDVMDQSACFVFADSPEANYVPSKPIAWAHAEIGAQSLARNITSSGTTNSTATSTALKATKVSTRYYMLVQLPCNSSYPLPAGQMYRWVLFIPKKYIS